MYLSKVLVSSVLLISIVCTAIASEKQPKKEPKQKSERFSCEGKRTCKQMSSCDEAMFYLNECGLAKLDRDHDGVPCESICK